MHSQIGTVLHIIHCAKLYFVELLKYILTMNDTQKTTVIAQGDSWIND